MTVSRGLRAACCQRGSALVLALVVMLGLLLLGLAIMAMGSVEVAVSGNWTDYSRAFYAAEAGLETIAGRIKAKLADGPALTDADVAQTVATQPVLPHGSGLTFTAFAVTRDNPNSPYNYLTQIASGAFTGLQGLVTGYTINSRVTTAAGANANLFQGIQHIAVPLFQFAIFYGKAVDLEMAPGAPMTVNGRVHANSNLYFGPVSTLSLASYTTTSGNVYRQIKRDPSLPCCGGTVQVQDAGGVYRTLGFDHLHDSSWAGWTSSQWQAQATSTWGGRLQDSAMGVGQIMPPIPELFLDPSNPDQIAHRLIEMPSASDSPALAKAKLYSQSGLRIVDGVATNASGSGVTLPSGTLATATFWDQRELKNVTVTEVDISKLNTVVPASNGLVFVASTTGNSVRVKNGTQLPSQGLSIASPNPVYVMGDFNTKGKDGTVVSHSPGTSSALSNLIPSAIMADAITVLSNNWASNASDTKGNQNTTARPATPTTINAAFALGPNTESVLNAGNGQVENVIRFLEDWSGGKTFTYNGSIVALWHSQQATGNWRNTGNSLPAYYNAPNRNWAYDSMFNSVLPPGTPMGVIINKGQWAQR